jgi:hypothetical protein
MLADAVCGCLSQACTQEAEVTAVLQSTRAVFHADPFDALTAAHILILIASAAGAPLMALTVMSGAAAASAAAVLAWLGVLSRHISKKLSWQLG